MTTFPVIVVDFSAIAIIMGTLLLSRQFFSLRKQDLLPFWLFERVVEYPRTNSLDDLENARPILLINDEIAEIKKSSHELIKRIREDVSLKLCGCAVDCGDVVANLFKWKSEFMTTAMDNIIISNSGIKLLVIKYSPRGHNRSMFIDINRYRNGALSMGATLSYLLTGMVAALTTSGDARKFLAGLQF
jgi:hypothetical protein